MPNTCCELFYIVRLIEIWFNKERYETMVDMCTPWPCLAWTKSRDGVNMMRFKQKQGPHVATNVPVAGTYGSLTYSAHATQPASGQL